MALDEVPKKMRIFSKLVLEKIGAFFSEPNFVKRLVARSPWASAARGRVRLKFGQAPLLTRFGRKIREFGLQSQTKRLSSVGCVSTFRGFAMVGQSKHKFSILHKSSIEELPLNFAVSPHYCKTLVICSAFFVN